MSEGRDPAIKLFGRKIPLPEEQPTVEEKGVSDSALAIEPTPEGEKDICKEKEDIEVANAMLGGPGELDHVKPLSSTGLSKSSEDDKKTSTETAKTSEKPNTEEDHKDADTSGEDKILKKPDKILPCPRCNSMDTKFCYYNNYNVNQPRHFCKNCQRYWTAGGTMRNVPVGAGRRKNKHSGSGYHHTVVTSEALESVQVNGPELTCHEALLCGSSAPKMLSKVNDTVLKFGPDAPLFGSMVSVPSLGEQNKTSELGFTAPTENRDEPSCSSSVTVSVPLENGFPKDAGQNAMNSYGDGIAPLHHLQCFTLPPLAYAWSPGWDAGMTAAVCSLEPVPGKGYGVLPPISWNQPPLMTAPAFCAPTLPFPFVPASFWGCMPSWTSGPWNLPWVGNNNRLSPPSSTSTSNCSGNGSSTLGKHSRDATSPGEEKTEKSLWVPKTLRIDDPDEAAKSSIFATLGIKPVEGGMFKAFPPLTGKGKASDVTQVLRANPAALSRSQSFQEAT